MFKPLVRLLAFFGKEINEVRRQPRLVLSLILGPFLILLLFGIGYRGTPPPLRIAMVVPESEMNNPRMERVLDIIDTNFDLVYNGSSEEQALNLLASDQVDVVEIFPDRIEERVASGEQAWIAFRYDEINPIDEQWLQYTGYVQINALNQAILMQATGEMQDEAAETSALLSVSRGQLDRLMNEDLSEAERTEARRDLSKLDLALGVLATNPAIAAEILGPDTDAQEIETLRADIAVLDTALENDTLDEEQERLQATRDRVARLEEATKLLSEVPSNVIIQPLQLEYQNTRGESLELVNFYAPGVLALIVQHMAVTLGALSLVRERLRGSIELFSVSPSSMMQVLVGKILAYTVFVGIISAVLVGLMVFGLRVPFVGGIQSIQSFAITMLLFVLASIGVGLLLSTLSNSDTQAVQLSMIVLLTSIFFSGFFLPLEQFYFYAQLIGYTMPVTHGMSAFQTIMLMGEQPALFSWQWLGLIAAVTLLAVIILWGRQYRRLR